MEALAFLITRDLVFADVIAEDVNANEVQCLIQARLIKSRHFRQDVVHFRHPRSDKRAICNHHGQHLVTTCNPQEVSCLRCLKMYDVQAACRLTSAAQDGEGR